MNKRLLLIIALFVLGIGVIVGIWYYFTSSAIVSFTLDSSVSSITLQKIEEGKEPTAISPSITTSSTHRLKKGEYSIIPAGEKVNQSPIKMTVEGDMTITIDPGYSVSYLSQLLTDETRTSIEQSIIKKSPVAMQHYRVAKLFLLQKGEWAGALLTPLEFDEQNPAGVHRAVLQKKGGVWHIMHIPQIVLTTANTPEVPRDILETINVTAL